MLAFGVLLGGVAWLYTFPLVLFLPEVVALERVRTGHAWGRAWRLALAHFPAALITMLGARVDRLRGRCDERLGRARAARAGPRGPAASVALGVGRELAGARRLVVGVLPATATLRFFAYIDCRTRGEAGTSRPASPRWLPAPVGWPRTEGSREDSVRESRGVRRLRRHVDRRPGARGLRRQRRPGGGRARARGEPLHLLRQASPPALVAGALSVCGHAVHVTSCAGFAEACRSPGVLPAGCTEPDRPLSLHWTAPPILGEIARVFIWDCSSPWRLSSWSRSTSPRMRRRSQDDRGLSDPPEPEAPAPGPPDVPTPSILDEEGLLLRAEKHALAGEYAQALQLYLGAALRSPDRRGAVRLAAIGRTASTSRRAPIPPPDLSFATSSAKSSACSSGARLPPRSAWARPASARSRLCGRWERPCSSWRCSRCRDAEAPILARAPRRRATTPRASISSATSSRAKGIASRAWGVPLASLSQPAWWQSCRRSPGRR